MPRVILIRTRRETPLEMGDGVSPPMGLLCLAAYARRERPGKDDFFLVDERVHKKSLSEWADIIREWRPDGIAISSLTVETDRLAALVPYFKKNFPQIPLFLGGPHASAAGPDLLNRIPVDFVVAGEGEKSFISLLEMLEQGRPYPATQVSGLAFTDESGQIVHWPCNQDLLDAEDLPLPAWDLIDLKDYQDLPHMTPFNGKRLYAPLITSRGCPYHCIYCHEIFGKKFRPRTAVQVADEIEFLITHHGVHEFEVYDDVFNLDKKRVLAICAEIKKRGLETSFSFPNGVRSDILDREVLEALASVGTFHVAFAVESASPRIQKLANKNVQLEKVQENIAIASELGIFCWGFFMLGFPTETRSEIWKTMLWAWKSPLHGAFFFIVIPQEGTVLAQEYVLNRPAEQKGKTHDYFDARVSLAQVSAMELWFSQSMAYVLFLMAPRRLMVIYRHAGNRGGKIFGTTYRLARYLLFQKPMNLVKRFVSALPARVEELKTQKH